ncbi:MAG TPA: polysaccharide deacetylase family protein [Acidimicrobiia bacterium]|nr:polysaccharide deacetylase family protein [Acidimicrobiia bacterium]
MKGPATPTTNQTRSQQYRQMLIGLVALPLSLLPFLAYGMFTAEGRIIRDRLIVAVSPPQLPELSLAEQQAVTSGAPRYQGRVMALVYHGVGSLSDGDGGFVVSPRRFAEHLATLRAAGMAAVTAADVARAFTGGAPLPDNAVLITFDDGRADALMFADPLLDQADMRATMFLISSATDRPNLYYAGWDRIEKAARSGRWDIQAHTHDSHHEHDAEGGGRLPVLTSLQPGESLDDYRARIRADLDRNDEAIEDHLGHEPVAFAYPFGAYGADRTNDAALRSVLREEIAARYAVAFHQDEQESVPLLDSGQDRFGLRRLEVGDWSGRELLGRIRQAAGGPGALGVTNGPSNGGDDLPDELVAPPTDTEVRSGTSATTTTGGRVGRLGPTTLAGGSGGRSKTRAGTDPAKLARPVTTTTSERPTTTSTEPTTAAQPPSTTMTSTTSTSSTSSTTTTTQPPTTTTTRPSTTTTRPSTTTTTTRPAGTTTTTTDKPCRGKGDKPCRR